MEEELITEKTAILAKEKKFNIKCYNGFYTCCHGNLYSCNVSLRIDYNSENSLRYSRPTQSLLQKWLRDGKDFKCATSYVLNK